jgi:hypothetical protein
MGMRYLTTNIDLPPGWPSSAVVRELLQYIFMKYRWFVPARYGSLPSFDEQLDPQRIDYDALLAVYEKHQSLCVAAQSDSDYICIFPARTGAPPYIGKLRWQAAAKSATKASWRVAHVEQVADVMRLVHAPLATASLAEDRDRKMRRLVHDGVSLVESFTVRDYSEGLAGLFWRNFLGPPFIRLFGERLAGLPPEYHTQLGEELVLVQPYTLPTEAGTESGQARERELITRLGPECFYDHARHTPPTRRPVLEHLSGPLH